MANGTHTTHRQPSANQFSIGHFIALDPCSMIPATAAQSNILFEMAEYEPRPNTVPWLFPVIRKLKFLIFSQGVSSHVYSSKQFVYVHGHRENFNFLVTRFAWAAASSAGQVSLHQTEKFEFSEAYLWHFIVCDRSTLLCHQLCALCSAACHCYLFVCRIWPR